MKFNAWLSWPPPAAAGAARIRVVCYNEWNHAVILLIALAKRLFPDSLQVELVTVEGHAGENDEKEIAGLESGVWDVALDTLTSKVFAARDRGAPVVIVGARRKTHSFLLFGQKGMSSVEDLRGKKVIACSPGDEMDIQSRQVLKDQGLEPGREVEIVYGGLLHNIFAMEDSFRQGQGEGLMATLPQGKRLVADGYPVLADIGKLYPPRHDRVMVARKGFMRDHSQDLNLFFRGVIRANRYFLDRSHKDEIVGIVRRSEIFSHDHDENVFDGIFEALYERVPDRPLIEEHGLAGLLEEERAKGKVKGALRLEDVLDLGPMKEVLKEL
jgi:ABC-type nitrate/sulfonate/bicarbonate transport system substrate-binding protein